MDLMRVWKIKEINDEEFNHTLMNYFSSSTVENRDLIFFKEDKQAVKLFYSQAGNLQSIRSTSILSKFDVENITNLIEENLIRDVGQHFYRRVAFFSQPAVGYFRYKNLFQLIEVPIDAPKPEGRLGPNPCLFEMKFPGSQDRDIQSIRAGRYRHKIEVSLNLIIPSFSYIQDITGGHCWVYGDIIDGDIKSEYKQPGYHYPGLGTGSPEFSSIDGVAPMDNCPSSDLYAKPPGVYPFENAIIPSDLAVYFDTISSLSDKHRSSFYRAAHWFHAAGKIASVSSSGYYVALVSAIESLLPNPGNDNCSTCGKPKGKGPTALFRDFVDKYAPDSQPRTQYARKNLYSLRSSLAHGSTIILSDEIRFLMSRRCFIESNQSIYLFQIVRFSIINWLLDEERNI